MQPRAATPGRRPRVRRLPAAGAGALATSVVALVLLATAGPALAHGPTGIFQPQPSSVVGPLQIGFRTRLIYANDTEPITKDATVTIHGTGPGGSVGPVRMSYTGSDGYYVGTVTFPAPGTWHLQYEATWPWLNLPPGPQAQYAFDQVVTAPVTTTAPPPTAAPSPAPTAPVVTAAPGGLTPSTTAPTTATTAADVTTTTAADKSTSSTSDPGTSTSTAVAAPGTTAKPAGGEQATSTIADQPSGGSGPMWALVAGGVVVAGGIAAAVVVLTGRRTPPAG